jgi:hypothetical protein
MRSSPRDEAVRSFLQVEIQSAQRIANLHIWRTAPDSSTERAIPAVFDRANLCAMMSMHNVTQLMPLAASWWRRALRPSTIECQKSPAENETQVQKVFNEDIMEKCVSLT